MFQKIFLSYVKTPVLNRRVSHGGMRNVKKQLQVDAKPGSKSEGKLQKTNLIIT